MGTKKRPCPSCGLSFLKGRQVVRLVGSSTATQIVCQSCFRLAVPVLASDAKTMCSHCGKNLARVCLGCVGKVIDQERGINVAGALAKQTVAARRKK